MGELIKISGKMARLPFVKCSEEFIREVCNGMCCRSSNKKLHIIVTVHPTEEEYISGRGGVITNGLLAPVEETKKCPFQMADDLCVLHTDLRKPAGCIISPFTFNINGTLIVRHRYIHMKCYNAKDFKTMPAYKAFRESLVFLFGWAEAHNISQKFDDGAECVYSPIQDHKAKLLREINSARAEAIT